MQALKRFEIRLAGVTPLTTKARLVEKNILEQYYDLKQEEIELGAKIERMEDDIRRLDERLKEIESGEMSKDSVLGGLGGLERFHIEGVPVPEYRSKRNRLFFDKIRLEERIDRQRAIRFELAEKVVSVERFISSVEDSHVRRIMRYRFEEHLPWNDVANKVGGGNTVSSVKMAYSRYMQGCDECDEKT